MNKSRFYEILQAYKNGEDVSSYIPKNPAEAQLLANIKTASSKEGEFFNIAQFDNKTEEAGYAVGGSTTAGTGQAILDAFNAGIRLVRIEDVDISYEKGAKYMNVATVMDCDKDCNSPFFNFVIVVCIDVNVTEDVVIEGPTFKYYIYTK